MRGALLILLLLAAIAAAVAWTMFGGNGTPPPSIDEPAATKTPAPNAPAAVERSAVPAPPPPAEPRAITPTPAAPTAPRDDAAPINVELRVRESTSQQPVAEFRWRFQSGDTTVKGDGATGAAGLRLGPGITGQVFVEAASFQPWVGLLTTPAANAAAAVLDVPLVPAAAATGITLLVHDTALQPVKNVRVDAFALAPESRGDESWRLGTPLWARRTSAPDGRYVLPELAPGEYGVCVSAVDESGGLLPLLPFVRRFELTGSNGFVEDVAMEPGCVLVLELVDATGKLLDPTLVGTTAIRMQLRGGAAVSRKWTVTNGAVLASAVDVLPGVGQVVLAEAVPGGAYELTVTVRNRPPVVHPLVLRAGDVPVERVVVP